MQRLQSAYKDIANTITQQAPDFNDVIGELRDFIVGTDVQVLNSDKEGIFSAPLGDGRLRSMRYTQATGEWSTERAWTRWLGKT